jgi:hypothetical protein
MMMMIMMMMMIIIIIIIIIIILTGRLLPLHPRHASHSTDNLRLPRVIRTIEEKDWIIFGQKLIESSRDSKHREITCVCTHVCVYTCVYKS